MKHLNLKLTCAFALSLLTTSTFAQFNWELGGNNGIAPNAVNATNNIFGTTPNLPIRIITTGTQRMHINGNVSPTNQGFIGWVTASMRHNRVYI